VHFHYGPASIELGDRRRELRTAHDADARPVAIGALVQPGSQVLRWQRQPRAEQARLGELLAHGARLDPRVIMTLGLREESGPIGALAGHPAHEDFILNPTLDEAGLEDFCVRAVAQLRGRGWRIRYDSEFPLRLMDLPLRLDAVVLGEQDPAEQGQIGVRLAASIDGEAIDLWSALGRTRELRAGDKSGPRDDSLIALHLADGRRLPLSQVQWRALDGLLDSAIGAFDGSLSWTIKPHQLGLLGELDQVVGEAQIDWQVPPAVRALAGQLTGDMVCETIPVPAGLQASLRPYQQLGLDWLGFLGRNGLGGILADDMGLGKTVQVLAHILAEQAAGRLQAPVLVVAPKSVLPNWQQETARFAPSLRCLALEGSARRKRFTELHTFDLVLTTYPLLSRDLAMWRDQPLALAVFDESQMLKNPATQAAKAARALRTERRLALTGTPLENHLGELWAQVDLVAPKLLGDRRSFEKRYRSPLLKLRDGNDLEQLRTRIRPFLLRRTKDQVARDLPPKTVVVRRIALEGAQAERYESMRARLSTQLEDLIAQGRGLQGQRMRVLEALLRLRQLCCDPRLLPADDVAPDDSSASERPRRTGVTASRGSAKLEHLLEMIAELLAEGRRILVFSQFTSMLALLAEALQRQRRPYLLLTGDSNDRQTPVRRFQEREVPLFLISLRAGGFGLNLTAADTVIHYDPWWNPAIEAQATDRAHRIGQDKPVFVYRLIAADTVEERILALQARKRELADTLFDESGQSLASGLSPDDWLTLLD
jgi:superfamily II DNA or RNA helicase